MSDISNTLRIYFHCELCNQLLIDIYLRPHNFLLAMIPSIRDAILNSR